MQESPWKGRDWQLASAALCGFAAIFVTTVLLARLPVATQPLSAWWTMATAIVVGGLAAASLELAERHSSLDQTIRIGGALAASGVTSLAILITTRQGGPPHLAFGCVLSLLFGSTSIAWAFRASSKITHETTANEPWEQNPVSCGGSDAGAAVLPDNIDQTLKRYLADGTDHLEACVRVRFQPGQQTAIVHLPIQPPMATEPEVECEPTDDADLRITVDPAQPYGIRLVCRRGGAWTEAADSVVAVLVTAKSAAQAAA